MKKIFGFFAFLLVSLSLALGAAFATGLMTGDDVFALLAAAKDSLPQSSSGGTSAQSGAPVSQFADHIPPTGEGQPLEGELPADRLDPAEIRHDFAADFYPYRTMLSAAEQEVYDQVYANALSLYGQIPLYTPISESSTAMVMSAVFYDHPELFWLETAYRYMYDSQGNTVAILLSFNETADSFASSKNRFDSIVAQVVAAASQLETAVSREKYVHDYLLDTVTYHLDASLNQSAYSALVNGETVCAGYARAFQHLMMELQIPCYYAAGYATEPHAWNIVRLDDGYYHVDVGWDDPVGNVPGNYYYNYFNLTDAQIARDHTRGDLSARLPACNATAYSYENAFGSVPEPPFTDTTANSLPTPAQAGYHDGEELTAIDDYYAFCTGQMLALGTGSHSFTVLISSRALADEITAGTASGEAIPIYMDPVARQMGFTEYSANVALQLEELSGDYWLLTQHIQFEGDAATAAEASPVRLPETAEKDIMPEPPADEGAPAWPEEAVSEHSAPVETPEPDREVLQSQEALPADDSSGPGDR